MGAAVNQVLKGEELGRNHAHVRKHGARRPSVEGPNSQEESVHSKAKEKLGHEE